MRMIAAVFSDIHGNYHAFRACYEDARRQGAEQFVFLGDYVSDLADPRRTMDLVYEITENYPTFCIRGNRERYMLEYEKGISHFTPGSKTGSLLFTYQQLEPRDLEFFRELQISERIMLGGVPFEIAHGSFDDDRCCLEPGNAKFQEAVSKMKTAYLLTGHTHKEYIQTLNGKTVLNPGSVGVPQGESPWPTYALLQVEQGEVSVKLRQVQYDMRAVIRSQFESGLVACSHCWGIGVLYDLIHAREDTIRLLENVRSKGDVGDEALWHTEAEKMGMKFTQQEIIDYLNHRLKHEAFMNETLSYYNQNADAFIEGTRNADMTRQYRFFLKYLPVGGTLLDLGCGSGRDSAYFASLGFRVTAVDGSEELCKRVRANYGIEAHCIRFEELSFEEAFDAVWACASLLHVSKAEMPGVLAKVAAALKPGGILYASFKYGREERVAQGRFFNDYTENDLDALLTAENQLSLQEYWITEDVRPDRTGERWLNLIAKKK